MEQIVEYFLRPENGVLGVIIVILIGVVIWQQRQLNDYRGEVRELQEKRKADTDAYTKSYTEIAMEQVATSRDSINTINLLQRSVDALATAVQSFINGRK